MMEAMPRGVLLPATCLVLVLACERGSKPAPDEVPKAPAAAKAPDPVDTPAAEPAPAEASPPPLALPPPPVFTPGPFELRVGKVSRRPTESFPRPRSPEDMQDHAWAFGWTTDGSAFAHCTVISGAVCKLCTFTKLDGTSETLWSGEECESGGALLSDAQLEARLVERGVAVRDAEWAHGSELVVTVGEAKGPPDDVGMSRSILEVGTEWRDGSPGATVHRENGCPKDTSDPACFVDAHADAILPSPDGSWVAILGHMWEGEFSDTFTLALVPAGRLAAGSYNKRGLDALARGDFEAAATAFLAAMHADTSAWKGPYNLACAYARAADPRARPALEVAVERGGEVVREKASKDGDLDSLRSQPWFTALIGPAK
jgi:hypothetical protein